jgi:hypothetical protein
MVRAQAVEGAGAVGTVGHSSTVMIGSLSQPPKLVYLKADIAASTHSQVNKQEGRPWLNRRPEPVRRYRVRNAGADPRRGDEAFAHNGFTATD